MPIRKIVVPIDGTPASRLALETACFVGQWLPAHVEAIHVRIEPTAAVPLVGEGTSGALIQDLIELTERESAERCARARAIFEDVRAEAGTALAEAPSGAAASASFVEVRGIEEEQVVRCARLADLAVIARPSAQAELLARIPFSAVVFESGTPVLVTGNTKPSAPFNRIMVAWNENKESARALKCAIPLLKRAEKVEIVTAGDPVDAEAACAQAAQFLAWHGIAASPAVVSDHPSSAAAISEACRTADLVVMGAYTHNRLWQLILGSVTRHMIEKTDLPLLMAH